MITILPLQVETCASIVEPGSFASPIDVNATFSATPSPRPGLAALLEEAAGPVQAEHSTPYDTGMLPGHHMLTALWHVLSNGCNQLEDSMR